MEIGLKIIYEERVAVGEVINKCNCECENVFEGEKILY